MVFDKSKNVADKLKNAAGEGIEAITDGGRKENPFSLINKLPFASKEPDPSTNYFVLGMEQTKGVPRDPDGVRITELEDPTYLGFDMEIVTDDSPLFSQVWCYLDKYQLHPECKSRHELYLLFLRTLTYYIKADRIGGNISEEHVDGNMADDQTADRESQSEVRTTNRAKFQGNRIENTEQLAKVYGLDMYTPEDTVAVKKHYISGVEGLSELTTRGFGNGLTQPGFGLYDDSLRSGGDKQKIKLILREDIVQWTKLLSKLYNDMVYSYKNNRRIVPHNILEFTLRIKVSELRNMARVQSALEQFNNAIDLDFRELIRDPLVNRAAEFWGSQEQVLRKELSAIQTLMNNYSFHRYTLHGCSFKFPIEYELDKIRYDDSNKAVDGIPLDIYYKKAYEEYASDTVAGYTTLGSRIFHMDNSTDVLIRTGQEPTLSGSNKRVKRNYANTDTSSKQLDVGEQSLISTLFDNFPALQRGREAVATAVVNAKDKAVSEVVGDLNRALGIKPIVPENIYRPGDVLAQFGQALKTQALGDISELLL